MGAVVFATDVRMASKEQVESLGGKFLTVEGAENLETEGGYAKEASEEFKKKQEDLLSETLKKIDPETTLFIIVSKTFTTQETITNANSVKKWFLSKYPNGDVSKHFIAVSSSIEKAKKNVIIINEIKFKF